ncbi:MAG: DUF4386 domain-containing protein [Rhizomicrobium sp.]
MTQTTNDARSPMASPATDWISPASVKNYARLTGVLMLVSILAGGFGEAYVQSKVVVSGDANATARNVLASVSLFRWGFASYLVEALCDITLAWLFYLLLRPVHRHLALLALCFGLVSTAVYACAELFYFAALVTLNSAAALRAFSPEQLNALALLCLRLSGYGGWIFLAFYGVPSVIRGYLIARSTYLPKVLGILLIVGGMGFVARDFAVVLVPALASGLLLAPMAVAGVALTAWLIVKGIDPLEWQRAEIKPWT